MKIGVVILILIGIIVGIILIRYPQIFNPKAATPQPSSLEELQATFRLQPPKSEIEQYLNPFGEGWINKRWANPDIPVLYSGIFDRTRGSYGDRSESEVTHNRLIPEYPPNYPLPDVTYTLDINREYMNLLNKPNNYYTFFGGGTHRASNYLGKNLAANTIVVKEISKINPNYKFPGYFIINFMEAPDLPVYQNMPEDWYVHKKGFSDASHRLSHLDQGKFILDMTKPALQDHLANAALQSMQEGELDFVLVDFSGYARRLAVAGGSLSDYPDHFSDQAYFQGVLQTLAKMKQKLNAAGKEVIFNPIFPDTFSEARYQEVNQLLDVSDGTFWENPFNKVTLGQTGQNVSEVQKYFDLAGQKGKKLIVEDNSLYELMVEGTCTFIPSAPNYCSYDSLLQRYGGYYGWLKEEQRLARLQLGSFMLFMNPGSSLYLHWTIHPESMLERSEAFFADYDLKIGAPLGKIERLSATVSRRVFQNGQVWVNYSDQPYQIPEGILTCDDFHQGICRTPHYVTADGVPVTSYILPPRTAMFFVVPSVLEPFNPSFETVWNWKPNQMEWGEVDYNVKLTGERSFKVSGGKPGSPGLWQKYYFRPNTTYTWSAWVKTIDNLNPRVVAVSVPGGVQSPNQVEEGRFVYDNLVPTGSTGDEWRNIVMTFTTSSGGEGLVYAALQNGSNGTVWFDDVTVEEGTVQAKPPITKIEDPSSPLPPDNYGPPRPGYPDLLF